MLLVLLKVERAQGFEVSDILRGQLDVTDVHIVVVVVVVHPYLHHLTYNQYT